MIDWQLVLLVGLVAGLSAAVQAATGFGAGLLALAILGLFLPVREVAVLVALLTVPLILMLAWNLRGHVRLGKHWVLLPGIFLGVPLGVYFLAAAPAPLLMVGLGGVMLVGALNGLIPRMIQGGGWHPVWLGLPCGFFSGALTGAFGTGGPPVIAYLATHGLGRYQFVATLQLILLGGGLLRIVELVRRDMIDRQIFVLGLTSLLFVWLGARLGLRLLHRISEQHFRLMVMSLLIFLGIRYLLVGISTWNP